MSIFLGAIKSKKISRGYYKYETPKFFGEINQVTNDDGSKWWYYTLTRKSDGRFYPADDLYYTKRRCLVDMNEAIKELEQ
jgi:hypothetical protein